MPVKKPKTPKPVTLEEIHAYLQGFEKRVMKELARIVREVEPSIPEPPWDTEPRGIPVGLGEGRTGADWNLKKPPTVMVKADPVAVYEFDPERKPLDVEGWMGGSAHPNTYVDGVNYGGFAEGWFLKEMGGRPWLQSVNGKELMKVPVKPDGSPDLPPL